MKSREWIQSTIEAFSGSSGVRLDASQTAIMSQQLEHMMGEIFSVEYPELSASKFFPFDTSYDPGCESIAYVSYDRYGEAKIISNYSDDLPTVNVDGTKYIAPVKGVGSSYILSIEDLRAAAMAGVPLQAEMGKVCRYAIELKLDGLAAFGDVASGLGGFLNSDVVPDIGVDTGSWGTANPDEIVGDVVKLWNSIPAATHQIHKPNTLLVDSVSFGRFLNRMTDTDMTILRYLETTLPGVQLIDQWHRLALANDAGTGPRIMAYKRDLTTGRVAVPQLFEQFPPQEKNLAFKVPCHARCGGALIHYPFAYAYMDGI